MTPDTPDLTRARWRAPVATLALVLLALAPRLFLLQQGLLLYTDDSSGYLATAQVIHDTLDLTSEQISYFHPIGYPLFLAAVRLFSANIFTIIVAQSLVGLVAVGVGAAIGWLGGSRLTAVALAAFLAVSPVYLLFERFLMSESLFLLTLLLYSALLLYELPRAPHPLRGALLGVVGMASLFIRTNSLFFILPLALMLFGLQGRRYPWRQVARGALGFAVVAALAVGGWMARNHAVYGEATLALNVTPTRLIYLGMHGLFDPTLPRTLSLAPAVVRGNEDPYLVMHELHLLGVQGAEEAGAIILDEQIGHNPLGYAREALLSVVSFWGVPLPGVTNERYQVRGWFTFAEHGQPSDYLSREVAPLSWRYDPAPYGPSPWSLAWRRLGTVTLVALRPLLALGATLCWLAALRRRSPLTVRRSAILMLGVGYLLTALGHALFLADYDRYSLPYDWIHVAIIGFTVTEWRERRQPAAGALSRLPSPEHDLS